MKFRQNRHSRRIRWIRRNRRFVGTPISSSIALWPNFAKIAILAEFTGFAKIAASSVPLSRAQSLFGEISPKSPFSPDLPKSPLRRYPYLELNRSLAKFRQNRHSRQIRRIRFDLWRNFVKIAKFAVVCISGHISLFMHYLFLDNTLFYTFCFFDIFFVRLQDRVHLRSQAHAFCYRCPCTFVFHFAQDLFVRV